MIIYNDEKVTANKAAKLIVLDRGEIGLEYWEESHEIEQDKLTEKEREDIQRALNRQYDRVKKFLNL